jgi:hypothetical protein
LVIGIVDNHGRHCDCHYQPGGIDIVGEYLLGNAPNVRIIPEL